MTVSLTTAGAPHISFDNPDSDYRPGVCNIGRDEINRRWRIGHLTALIAIALFAVLVVIDVPPLLRFVVAVPAAVAAACYIEAALKFCVRFGVMGVFNFGGRGAEKQIVDVAARARDRSRAIQLSAASLVIAVAVGTVAVLLPV